MSEDKRYIRIKTAAKMYDYNPQQLRMKCLLGQVHGATKDGKEWRIPIESMEKIMQEGIPERHRRPHGV